MGLGQTGIAGSALRQYRQRQQRRPYTTAGQKQSILESMVPGTQDFLAAKQAGKPATPEAQAAMEQMFQTQVAQPQLAQRQAIHDAAAAKGPFGAAPGTPAGQEAALRMRPELQMQTPEERAALMAEARGYLDPQREAVRARLAEMAQQAFEGTAEQMNVRGLRPESGLFAQELTRQILPQTTEAMLGLERMGFEGGMGLGAAQRGEFGTALQGALGARGQDVAMRGQDIGLQTAMAQLAEDRRQAGEEQRLRRRLGVGQLVGGLLGSVVGQRFGGQMGGQFGGAAGAQTGSALANIMRG